MGPKLRAKGVIPMSAEASEWLHTWSNESACCSEPSGLPSSDPPECGGFNGDPIAEHCTTDFGGYDYGHALVVGEANAWLWWWYSGNTTNEGLIQQSGSVTTKRYYTFGSFTRYIRPGYHRVAVTGVFPEKVLVSAYTNDSGKVVVVAINETTSAQTVPSPSQAAPRQARWSPS
ncbi:glycoside hydrolase family 30 beta sandwich domain-containing protein [Sorangium sp. So ce1151]|uniref:glycoside hydrolase family 30 beta sandwich domain-containing protein n=1 Tax=Sorangium sp. So ce1151 TaxID=3133332 RepID=UPI003F644CD8